MCTAITFQAGDFYFGRTLDHDQAYGEEVTITPRRYPFHFRHCKKMLNHDRHGACGKQCSVVL